jgi:uncharacterized protein (TIGR03435 family)
MNREADAMHALRRSILFAAAASICPLFGQDPTPDSALQFDVAIIKPTADRTLPGLIVHLPGESGYRGANMALMNYFTVALQVRTDQISGPDWLTSEYFDMEGKAGRSCTADELHLMLQHLLEERFHIKMHRETRQIAGYNLVVDSGGPKLADHDPEDRLMLPIQPGPGGSRQGKNVSMQYLAFYLSQELGQTVVDQTGLKGHYDFNAKWGYDGPMMVVREPPAPGSPGAADLPVAPPVDATVFESLRKQLGLRLDKAKVPTQKIVIDHIEKLTGN